MDPQILQTSIEYLKGVGPVKGDALKKELGIFRYADLLHHYPFRYVDRTQFHKISEISPDMPSVQLSGKILRCEIVGQKRGKRFAAYLEDDSGTVELIWFQGIKWIKEKVKPGKSFVVFGKPNFYGRKLSIAHPELEETGGASPDELSGAFSPVYHTTENLKAKGLDSRGFQRLTRQLLQELKGQIPEILPEKLLSGYRLMGRDEAFQKIHFPETSEDQEKAGFRIKFEELLFTQLRLIRMKLLREKKVRGPLFKEVGEIFNTFFKSHLPFELTGAQKRVIKEIRSDTATGQQMNRLLQGDVGSGKTLVALMSMLLALDNGYQAALMVPTEILANQHYDTLMNLVKGMGINIGLLTGSTKTSERKQIQLLLESGELHILIGTHALIEEDVTFKNLGFVVIDEQHKFGVAQRARLWKKGRDFPPHVLVMTATPIPRTLAMTLYGDLDISIIDELPPGRTPVSTLHRYETHRARLWGFLKEQIREGRQVYIVYPLIEESEKLDLNNLYEGYESVCRDFPPPEYRVSIVHGKMNSADKDFEMRRFEKKETQILVATTVIEVGVNIPNATVMVIENAERFGLAQLHQLRGRVGRGADKSYCVLMTSHKLTAEAKARIGTMCETTDGFRIAEVDLKLRGPGDLLGTQQSGEMPLRLADLVRDQQILHIARNVAINLLQEDPDLAKQEHEGIRLQLQHLTRNTGAWEKIS